VGYYYYSSKLKGGVMPRSWSKKDERQYEHIKKSEKGNKRAKEIAARTVNKQRKQEGRTKSK
jgi:hypothetical protein